MSTRQAEVYRSMFNTVHEWLEGTMEGMSPEQAMWQPPGLAVPAGAHYAHHMFSEDGVFNGAIRHAAPLFASDFAGKTGTSEPMPMGGPWDAWARSVQLDLPTLREYAKAVYESTDQYLAGLSDDDLAAEHDFSALGVGTQPLSFMMNIMVTNAAAHCGEMSCVKGLQGLKGYPF